jgi:phage terminase large subunit
MLDPYVYAQEYARKEAARMAALSTAYAAAKSAKNLNDQSNIAKVLKYIVDHQVTPKMNAWRLPARWKIGYGGRGAGAKSWGGVGLLDELANHETKSVICLREIQNTLAESAHKLIAQTIRRRGYSNWKITDEKIYNTKNGSYFIFRGLKDLRASQSIKGMEDFDIAFVDEASGVSVDSWIYLIPTMRKPGSEIWAVFNREEEMDPIYEMYVLHPPKNSIILQFEPGAIDNPWWNDTTLQEDWDWWKAYDPDEAEHIYGGQPRKQNHNSVLSRVKIRSAMDRDIIDPKGALIVGCDPADFGNDKTEIYIRKGLKIVDHKTLSKMDGVYVANEIAAMIKHDPSILINIDSTGIGASARDHLRWLGLKVNAIHFGEAATDEDLYGDIVSEMWFNFNAMLDDVDIPNDPALMQELSGRKYDYDNKGRRKIEPKAKFKERLKRSPDKADALLLCYFTPGRLKISDEVRAQMRARRGLK